MLKLINAIYLEGKATCLSCTHGESTADILPLLSSPARNGAAATRFGGCAALRRLRRALTGAALRRPLCGGRAAATALATTGALHCAAALALVARPARRPGASPRQPC